MKDGNQCSNFNYLALDENAENLSLAPSQCDLDSFENHISNQFYPELTFIKQPMINMMNENKACFGISKSINESFLALNGNDSIEFSNGAEVCKPAHCHSLSRKDTLHSSLRKTSDLSSLSIDQLRIPEQQNSFPASQMKFIGYKRKCNDLSREQKKEIKLERNRLSDQKSRQKKKAYVNELEEKLIAMEEELQKAKQSQFQNMNTIENKLENLKTKETEYYMFFNSCHFKNTRESMEERRQMQNDYTRCQNKLICELYKGIIKNMVPLDIRYFEMKCQKLKDIYNFECLNTLLENLNENQFMLNEAYNFQFNPDQAISFPLHVYMFYEQLKKFTLNFKECLLKVRK
jgi:hypothetical protein